MYLPAQLEAYPLTTIFFSKKLFYNKTVFCKYNLETHRETEDGRFNSKYVTNYSWESTLLDKWWVYFPTDRDKCLNSSHRDNAKKNAGHIVGIQ